MHVNVNVSSTKTSIALLKLNFSKSHTTNTIKPKAFMPEPTSYSIFSVCPF